jgi:predicted helicase
MACGTGKTLVTLWTAEQLGARKILVLLPSLALLRQTLHEWLKETSLDPLAYLCVCSDPTVKGDADEISTAQSDLDFEVSTNPEVVRRFLDAPFDGTKIVFSTYQSASVVGEAMKPEETFDLGIFDEAHKTAGREGSKLSYALKDENISISKRLFVTATPRHYNPRKKDELGDSELVFSMDNPENYGPICFFLGFGEAVKRGIICGYKVVISVITAEMVTNELIKKGSVIVNGDDVSARQVANQIVLRDAVRKYSATKIFTFHNTVTSSAHFVSEDNQGIKSHLPEFATFHVNGKMQTSKRERIMRDFRTSERAILSNARCLTEGVDVPAVDMVAFLSPRRSLVDIVQATGRAMRLSPGKKVGFVLVPLFVEQAKGESIEDAINRADYDEIWDVLQSLQEQDDILAESIKSAGIDRRLGREHVEGLGERIDIIGPSISLELLKRSVSISCIDKLFSTWDSYYHDLQRFKKDYAHVNVPKGFSGDPSLPIWIGKQIDLRNRGLLAADRYKKLSDLGVSWIRTWEDRYRELQFFKEVHGHCNVPQSADPTDPHHTLGSWVSIQRAKKKKNKLSHEQIRLLDELGFAWVRREKYPAKPAASLEEMKNLINSLRR